MSEFGINTSKDQVIYNLKNTILKKEEGEKEDHRQIKNQFSRVQSIPDGVCYSFQSISIAALAPIRRPSLSLFLATIVKSLILLQTGPLRVNRPVILVVNMDFEWGYRLCTTHALCVILILFSSVILLSALAMAEKSPTTTITAAAAAATTTTTTTTRHHHHHYHHHQQNQQTKCQIIDGALEILNSFHAREVSTNMPGFI